MASNRFVTLAMVTILLPTVAMAKEYIVGDDSGWTVNYDYQAWAKDKVFHVNDTLVFRYTANNHDVRKVNATEFKDCIVTASNNSLSSGNDIITLGTPGDKWYICGQGSGSKRHCADLGQKLALTVVEDASSAAFRIITSAGSPFIVAAMVLITMVMV